MHTRKMNIVLSHRRELEKLEEDPCPLTLSPKLLYDDAGYFIRISSMYNGQWQPLYSLYEIDDVILAIIEGRCVDLKNSLTNPNILQEKIPIGEFKLEIPLKVPVDPSQSDMQRDEGFIR
ncbi:hypothetical protein I4U23_010662 [Adineta vaga]|nr:hypothetical protein I4U23_010662 [Adineta vaga]